MRFGWLVFPALATVAAAGYSGDTNASQIRGYRAWRKATAVPVDMSQALVALCSGPDQLHGADNLHVKKVFLVYVNKAGEKAMFATRKPEFPDGAVIVKEKYDQTDLVGHQAGDPFALRALRPGSKPVLLTVMAKESGKWSYFAVNGSGKVLPSDTKTCEKCHEANRDRDYVFRSYIAGPR